MAKKLPQRITKCLHCGLTVRATIIGSLVKPTKATAITTGYGEKKVNGAVNPEYATSNAIKFRMW